MKPWHEKVGFTQPLHGVRLAGVCSAEEDRRRSQQEREQMAYERGRLDGEKALSEQLLQQRHELLELQKGVLQSLSRVVPQVIGETESVLIELAIETARKLVADLPITAEMIEAAIRQALAQVRESTAYHVFLHADDLALLRRINSPLLLPDGGPDQMRFDSSPDVTRGGCIVQTRFGIIDARRETKIDLLKEALQS
jgi:flagellar assembly protein FliH